MKGNGYKLGWVLFFLGLSVYYLWPSVGYYSENRKIKAMTEEARTEYQRENITKLSSLKERALNLGLDLQGGMHVTLEVQVGELVRSLATDQDEIFDQAYNAARDRIAAGEDSFIDAFVQEFRALDPNARLSRYFRNDNAGISRRSSNEDVISFLRKEAGDAVTRAIEIIRDRVDRFGVTEPSIQKQGNRRVIVELPGVDDAQRVRKLLRGTAQLEFRLMANPDDVVQSLQSIIEYYEEEVDPVDSTETAEADTTFDIDAVIEDDVAATTNHFLDTVTPVGQGVLFGYVDVADTSAANALFRSSEFQTMLPPGIELLYGNEVVIADNGSELFPVLTVAERTEMKGEVVVDAAVDFDPTTNVPMVSMTMNSEGAKTWARLTGANVGNFVAIVLDDVVYSYPVVRQPILGGRSSIEGVGSREEAQDIVTVLKSGALPAPVEIVGERTVGPSLGAASIRAGFRSVMVGLLLVAIFMIIYYRTAGIVADLALIVNILFILGILAGFSATLTLPGIAGIVLTIGMAVDANVLIFERIREEQGAGKTLKASIEGGYAKALSAIVDANITTFFVGAILYSFGVGPIKGFAVTLMAGILASLFSAIVVTRLVFDYLIAGKKMTPSFG